jgi:hypothetical protein
MSIHFKTALENKDNHTLRQTSKLQFCAQAAG